jgi:hypothetical protein
VAAWRLTRASAALGLVVSDVRGCSGGHVSTDRFELVKIAHDRYGAPMEVRRYDEEAGDETGQGRVALSDAQAATMAKLGGMMRVLGLVQAAIAGSALLLLLAAIMVGLYGEDGPGLAGLPVLALVLLVLILFQVAAPALQGVMVAGAGNDLAAVARPEGRAQPRLFAAFARVRVVFLIEVVVALMLLVKELKYVL